MMNSDSLRRELHELLRDPFAWVEASPWLGQNQTLRQLFRFGSVGVLNTLIDFGLYILLTRSFAWFGQRILLANLLAFLAAVSFSFMVNKTWTFRNLDQRQLGQQYAKFVVVNALTLAVIQGGLYLFSVQLGWPDLLVKVGTVLVAVVGNFLANKHWTFGA